MKFDFEISIIDSVILPCIKSKAMSLLWDEILTRDYFIHIILSGSACMLNVKNV